MEIWFDAMCKSGRCTRSTKKTSSTAKGKKWMKCVSKPGGGYKRVHWGQRGVTVSGKRKGREESLSEQDTNVLLVKEETIPRDVWLVEIGDCCGIL